MAKPYRRKVAGKLVGSWLVRVGGERINLSTKDANEARRRARLAERGEWPPDDAAADAVKETLDGGAEAPTSEPESSLSSDDGSTPQPAAVAPPTPVVAEPAAPVVDVAGAVNETAASVSAEPPIVSAAVDPVSLRREFNAELRRELTGAESGTEGEIDLAALVAGATRELVNAVATRRDPPRHLPSTCEPHPKLLRLENIALKYLAVQHGARVPEISPGWALVVLAVVDLIVVVRALEPGLAPEPVADNAS